MGYEKNGEELEGYIRWFSEIHNDDIGIAGGKGASLGEMYNAGFPVPPGFAITAQAFDYFIKQNGLKDKIKAIIETIDMEDTNELTMRSKEIRALIESQEMPEDLKQEILEAYHILSSEKIETRGVSSDALNILKNSQEPVFVAVRSSATTEDLATASFAGQQESFLNIKGDFSLIEFVKKCFSSLYTARAIYYRNRQGFGGGDALLSVIIMKMIDSEKSGVIFSRDPVGDQEYIAIEAVYGLGEGIVSGRIMPDHYLVSRNLEIKEIKLADKKIAVVRTGSGQSGIVKLTPERSKSRVLSNGQIIEAANYAVRLEEYYKKPQDIEFAVEGNKFYVVQSRPITTLGKEVQKTAAISGKVLLEGSGSSPGIGVGTVKIIKDMGDLSKIKKGDVLVTEMTNPDMVVAMQKSIAIVTDEGGMTSHASIVSRELGIPCVVGTGNATSVLKDGMKITVDGANGKVYEGEVATTQFAEIKPALKTNRIKLKIILDLPEVAERASQAGVDAIGLLRIEGIIASSEKHPLQYEKDNNLEDYSELLRKGIEAISKNFNSVWIRTSDIRTDEYSSLKGAPERELNPMLGLHGIRFSLKHPKIFEAELLAIKEVAEKYPNKRFGVMFPQVISVDEVKRAKEYFDKYKTQNMDFGVMIETPAAVQIIEDICKEEIKFISFGTNDLTQFTLAVDRGEEDVQFLYHETNPAIFSEIRRVIGACKRNRVETSICGQAGSNKEMIEFLFKQGINSISVNADAAYETSKLINELEEKRNQEFEERNKQYQNRQEYQKQQAQRQQVQQIPKQISQQAQPSQQFRKPYPIFEKKQTQPKQSYQATKYQQEEREELPELPQIPELPQNSEAPPISVKVKEYDDTFDNAYIKEPEIEGPKERPGFLNKDRIKIAAEMQGEEDEAAILKRLNEEENEIERQLGEEKFNEIKGEERVEGAVKSKVKKMDVEDYGEGRESLEGYKRIEENSREEQEKGKDRKEDYGMFKEDYE